MALTHLWLDDRTNVPPFKVSFWFIDQYAQSLWHIGILLLAIALNLSSLKTSTCSQSGGKIGFHWDLSTEILHQLHAMHLNTSERELKTREQPRRCTTPHWDEWLWNLNPTLCTHYTLNHGWPAVLFLLICNRHRWNSLSFQEARLPHFHPPLPQPPTSNILRLYWGPSYDQKYIYFPFPFFPHHYA